MNQKEIVKTVAKKSQLPRNQVNSVLNNFFAIVIDTAKEDGTVKIPGFGKFKCKAVAEHSARNPATQEPITVAAYRKIVFIPGAETKNL